MGAQVAVIGGSGLYHLLDEAEERVVDTPYGPPSGPVTIADVAGVPVAFLPRHGRRHELPPHRINYRANLWALHSLGVRKVVAPAAVGALDSTLGPGDLVVPDQLVDWTRARSQTFHDTFPGPPLHASFADPYDKGVRAVVVAACADHRWPVRDGGTLVVIDGPRFSTRAESRFFAAQGWSVVNMTAHPEAVLARELDIAYATLALVTDVDAGAREGEGVTVDLVLSEFARSTERLRAVLLDSVVGLGAGPVEA